MLNIDSLGKIDKTPLKFLGNSRGSKVKPWIFEWFGIVLRCKRETGSVDIVFCVFSYMIVQWIHGCSNPQAWQWKFSLSDSYGCRPCGQTTYISSFSSFGCLSILSIFSGILALGMILICVYCDVLFPITSALSELVFVKLLLFLKA